MQLDDKTKGMAKSASISAVIRRADGSIREDLGVISYWHRNPLKRWAWAIRNFLKQHRSKV